MDSKALLAHTKEALGTYRERACERIAEVRAAFLILESDPELTFRVEIHSYWETYGEKMVYVQRKGDLDTIIQEATDLFKKTNNRSDVQGRYSVSVIIGSLEKPLFQIPLPDTFWKAP